MSGILALLQLDGGPVERSLVEMLTRQLEFRGPDRSAVRCLGPVGLGHTLLATAEKADLEEQPCSLDEQVLLTADARLDARSELLAKLSTAGCVVAANATDAELILHAYAAWDTDCVAHLIGDFAFALWDSARKRMFCARDHLGVKQLYYSRVGSTFAASNTMECLRKHPAVSSRLNELAIADFLMFGGNQEMTTTVFADIQRLPPAHVLIYEAEQIQVRKYWTLSVGEELRYRRPEEYCEHFHSLLDTAVADRLGTRRVGVLMTGGLDSSSIASSALSLLRQSEAPFELLAHTIVHDDLIPDEERHYSGLVAKHLQIPIDYLSADPYRLYDRALEPGVCSPEPANLPLAQILTDKLRQAAQHSRVLLTGWDGDSLVRESPHYYFKALRTSGQYVRWGWDYLRFLATFREFPSLGLRTKIKRWWNSSNLSKSKSIPKFPAWIESGFSERLNLRERWESTHRVTPMLHPRRPCAMMSLSSPNWSSLFEGYDPALTLLPMEVRHPLLDLRMVEFLLSLPAIPWCMQKRLIRKAMRGKLPEDVLSRPKTPLAGDQEAELLRSGDGQCLDEWQPRPEMAYYVQLKAIPRVRSLNNRDDFLFHTRPFSLNLWFEKLHYSTKSGDL